MEPGDPESAQLHRQRPSSRHTSCRPYGSDRMTIETQAGGIGPTKLARVGTRLTLAGALVWLASLVVGFLQMNRILLSLPFGIQLWTLMIGSLSVLAGTFILLMAAGSRRQRVTGVLALLGALLLLAGTGFSVVISLLLTS